MYDYQPNQVVTPIALDVANVVSLLKQINTFSDSWNTVTDLVNIYLVVLSLLLKTIRSFLLSI